MNERPRVSVIIPTYNRLGFLSEAVRSVLAQQYGNYEIIIADDGSTDGTAEWASTQPRPVRYLRLSHSGMPSITRNRGAEVARGEFLAFLDDDDLWEPAKLARQIPYFDNRGIGLVYSNVTVLDDEAPGCPILPPDRMEEGNIFSRLIEECFIHPSTVVTRRVLFESVGGFDESIASAEDYDLWLRLAYLAPVAAVPEPLVRLRRHPGEISRLREVTTYQSVIGTLEHLPARVPLSPGQRLALRRSLARRRCHLGILCLGQGDARSARRHLLRSLRLNPIQRAAWYRLIASFRTHP